MRKILVLLCLLTNLTYAQTTYAVIVGVSDYKIMSENTGDLHFAEKDAIMYKSFLNTGIGGNVPDSNIVLLTNGNATYANIIYALESFKKADSTDKVIFYFSGHGQDGRFLPYDFNSKIFLLHSEVKKAFKQSDAGIKLLIADACMAGSMKTETNSTKPIVADSAANNKNANRSKIIVLMSSRKYQKSLEFSNFANGAFTYYLLKGLNGDADEDINRRVTIKELYKYLSPQLNNTTHGQQNPIIYGRFDDDFIMAEIK
jgi:Caspase domain